MNFSLNLSSAFFIRTTTALGMTLEPPARAPVSTRTTTALQITPHPGVLCLGLISGTVSPKISLPLSSKLGEGQVKLLGFNR